MFSKSEKYDLIIIGGGPAGCAAAAIAAKNGLRTLLLEKDRDFGHPVRCAGALADIEEIKDFIPLNHKWVTNSGSVIRLGMPDGTMLTADLNQTWALIDRKVFDYQLAVKAAECGAELRNRCCAAGIQRSKGVNRVVYEHFDKKFAAEAPLVIGADGAESRAGRWAGLKTALTPGEISVCWQYTLHHPNLDSPQILDAYLGEKVAPGGYIWVFPLGNHYANVGIGIPAFHTVKISAKEYLDRFVTGKFPGASVLSSTAGSVPSAAVTRGIVGEGIMLAGDAARQTCPLTGGGIIWGMWGGKLAGETALEAHKAGDFSAAFLSAYFHAWRDKIGGDHNRKLRLRNIFRKIDDRLFIRTAGLLQDIAGEKLSKIRLMQIALLKAPGLVKEAVRAYLNWG